MQKQTPLMVGALLGLLVGRLVDLHEMKVIELTGLACLIFSYGSEIWEAVKKFAAKPAVRTYLSPHRYVSPRSAQGQRLVLSSSFPQKLAFLAGLAFGGLILIFDAMHRHL